MKDFSLYETMTMPDPNFPIKIHKNTYDRIGVAFKSHWHEHIELLYVLEGKAVVECGKCPQYVQPGDLVLVNSNELHQGESIAGPLAYYCIILDVSLLLGQLHDICESKYISPISSNLILFSNKISGDASVKSCVDTIIREYEGKSAGFELEIKSAVYHLLVMLLRNYSIRLLTEKEYRWREKNLDRFIEIFKYIETNYTEKITIHQCAQMLNITDSHFCHLFKLIAEKPLSGYINNIRLKKAETLLRNTVLSITEIALATGFNDIAYFTRLFKEFRQMPPSRFRNEVGEQVTRTFFP